MRFTIRSLLRLSAIIAIGLSVARRSILLGVLFAAVAVPVLLHEWLYSQEIRAAVEIRHRAGVGNVPGCCGSLVVSLLIILPSVPLSQLWWSVIRGSGVEEHTEFDSIALIASLSMGVYSSLLLFRVLWHSRGVESS